VAAACYYTAPYAIARIGHHSHAETRAVDMIRQYLKPRNVPSQLQMESQFTRRDGVWAMCWLLRGKAESSLREMRFFLTEDTPNTRKRRRRTPTSALLYSLPGTFAESGATGVELAASLLDTDDHLTLRTGLLSLGVAAQARGDQTMLSMFEPYLAHPNGAVRDAAHLAAGFAFQKSGGEHVLGILESASKDSRRGPSTNYPLAVGLVCQGTENRRVALGLAGLAGLKRRRLTRHAALGVGLIYQGTSSPQAVELLLPLLESRELGAACEALQLVDFDEVALEKAPVAAFPRCHSLADGPGAARMFVLKHFLVTPPTPLDLNHNYGH
jgi:hypothetical protein